MRQLSCRPSHVSEEAVAQVYGHSGDKWNDRADALVQLGKKGERSPGVPVLGPSLGSPRRGNTAAKRRRTGAVIDLT